MPSTIREGSQGPDVIKLQEALSTAGLTCKVDGRFGPNTNKLVLQYQTSKGLTPDGVVGPKTWSALLNTTFTLHLPTAEAVLQQAQKLGYAIWNDPWHLWFFGIRGPNRNANSFDDLLGCTWVDETGKRCIQFWLGTTDPGTYWLLNPSNSLGCAILTEGQYLDAWQIALHRGKYEALCQRLPVQVYRDPSKDNKLDLDKSKKYTGIYGINIHAATQVTGGVSQTVDKWSAGCQVHATEKGFHQMMDLAKNQVLKTGRKTFSYTLLNQW